MKKKSNKRYRYFFEAAAAHFFFALFRLLPLDAASGFGGFLGRMVGPHLPSSQTALNNLKQSLPGKNDAEYRAIVTGMWDNLGRILAEYPHLEKIARERVEVPDTHYIDALLDDNLPAVILSAHLGNWEVTAPTVLNYNLALDVLYRAPNNPMVQKLLDNARSLKGRLASYPKSREGMKDVVKAMKDGHHLGILVDQKYNKGIPATFFGRTAMTSTTFVTLAQKFKCPLIPGYVERQNGSRFKIHIFDPVPLFDENGNPIAPEKIVDEVHRAMESWITEIPEQWLWIHNRWADRTQPEETSYSEEITEKDAAE